MASKQISYHFLNLSGRGLPVRHLLAMANYDYVEKSYDCLNPVDNCPDPDNHLLNRWKNDKPELQKTNPFVLLPYLITEEGQVISSTQGMMIYLGKRFGYLTGLDDTNPNYEIINAFDQAQELREGFIFAFNDEDHHNLYANQDGYVGPWRNMKTFENKLATTGLKYLFSDDQISITDIYVFSTLSMMRKWHSKLLENYPMLDKWYTAMLENEGLKAQVEKEKTQPILAHQSIYDMWKKEMNYPMSNSIVWGTPQKMEPKF